MYLQRTLQWLVVCIGRTALLTIYIKTLLSNVNSGPLFILFLFLENNITCLIYNTLIVTKTVQVKFTSKLYLIFCASGETDRNLFHIFRGCSLFSLFSILFFFLFSIICLHEFTMKIFFFVFFSVF